MQARGAGKKRSGRCRVPRTQTMHHISHPLSLESLSGCARQRARSMRLDLKALHDLLFYFMNLIKISSTPLSTLFLHPDISICQPRRANVEERNDPPAGGGNVNGFSIPASFACLSLTLQAPGFPGPEIRTWP